MRRLHMASSARKRKKTSTRIIRIHVKLPVFSDHITTIRLIYHLNHSIQLNNMRAVVQRVLKVSTNLIGNEIQYPNNH